MAKEMNINQTLKNKSRRHVRFTSFAKRNKRKEIYLQVK